MFLRGLFPSNLPVLSCSPGTWAPCASWKVILQPMNAGAFICEAIAAKGTYITALGIEADLPTPLPFLQCIAAWPSFRSGRPCFSEGAMSAGGAGRRSSSASSACSSSSAPWSRWFHPPARLARLRRPRKFAHTAARDPGDRAASARMVPSLMVTVCTAISISSTLAPCRSPRSAAAQPIRPYLARTHPARIDPGAGRLSIGDDPGDAHRRNLLSLHPFCHLKPSSGPLLLGLLFFGRRPDACDQLDRLRCHWSSPPAPIHSIERSTASGPSVVAQDLSRVLPPP